MKSSLKFLFKPVFFILALTAATYVVLYVEKLRPSDLGEFEGLFIKDDEIVKRENYALKPPAGKLNEEEIDYARIAWKYFENNYDENTGLVNGKDECPMFSFKDLTAYLMGMMSAYEIGIVDSIMVEKRIVTLINTLEKLQLHEDKLPNQKYHSVSLQMLGQDGEPLDEGIGWSAMDIGRFFAFVNKVKFDYPQHFLRLRKVIKRWKINEMIKNGAFEGMVYHSNIKDFKLTQEGRLGYEEYSGKNLFKAGFDLSQALIYTDFIKFVNIYGQEIAVDARESRSRFSHNYVTSEPYFLDGLEYGWDVNSKELSYRIYLAQKKRYEKTGILTATGEDYSDHPEAGYVYNTVYADFKTWVCYDEKGKQRNDLKTLSTKTAFAWYVLYDDDYSEKLFNTVKDLNDPKKGWYSGIFENSGKTNKVISASTNGIILECLNYKLNGTLIQF
jgi:hypothetical protein